MQKALLILPWCHPSSRKLELLCLQTKPKNPEKQLAKVQGFSFLVWNASTKSQAAFNVLLL